MLFPWGWWLLGGGVGTPLDPLVPHVILGPSAGDRDLAPSHGNATIGPSAAIRTVSA